MQLTFHHLRKPSGEFLRRHLSIALLGLSALAVAGAQPALTNASQLRALSADQASEKLPVFLRAVVTVVVPTRTVFLQDETGGTFITGAISNSPSVSVGDLVLVHGVSFPGLFVPGLTADNVEVVGRSPLPKPADVVYDDLLSGRWHYERVRLEGVIRTVTPGPPSDRLWFTVAVGHNRLEVQAISPAITNVSLSVNTRVRLTGLATGYINDRRQLITPQLLVGRPEDIEVVSQPPADPFAAPLLDSATVMNFAPSGIAFERVRVRGVVTHQRLGETLYLRDEDHGVLVQTAQNTPVRPGDEVEAVGFPAMGRFSAFLEDAEFRVRGHRAAPPPRPISINGALQGTNDADLVTLEARLIEALETPTETLLVIGAENTVFRARLPRTSVSLRPGSDLRLTGVCRVAEPAFSGERFGGSARAIELLLGSPEDIVVVAAPSWWTPPRLAAAAAVLLGLAVAAVVWIAMLRRRVAEQAQVIGRKVQREAALEERHRMAREIHDTLAQSFSGLGFQLEALNAKLPPQAGEAQTQLQTARQMVRHGQESFRRSLMNLRAQELDRGGLAEALPELARQMTAGTGIEVHCETASFSRGIPEPLEANLLRIGQECLSNAVQHGRPRRIDLSLQVENGSVCLRITDDGVGFDPSVLKTPHNGHFGWRGIHERAEQIGGRVELRSQPGQGATVTVTAPLPS